MKRFFPRSLLGQVILAVALTLFVMQGINGILAWRIEKDRQDTAVVNTLGFRFVAASRIADMSESERTVVIDPRGTARPRRDGRFAGEGRARRAFANAAFERSDTFPSLASDKRMADLEARLADTLRSNGRSFSDIRLVERALADDPVAVRFFQRRAMRRAMPEGVPQTIAVAGIETPGGWEIVRAAKPPSRPFTGPLIYLVRAAGLTLILSLVLWFVLQRITRPLAELTRRTERFSSDPGNYEPIDPSGPDDVRKLITAHNEMEARIGAMLDEKDVMLGAIGHDLKTPLAALRVRTESVPDDIHRARMAETIEEITHTLDDILALARVGRAHGELERTDIAALAASVVDEFEDLGELVQIAELEKAAAPARVNWLKRGLRNLVTNALRYAGEAHVSVIRDAGSIVLRVDDRGPGIPDDRIAEMLEPFARGEASRNRATGGAGLGLTLARAVAEQHGGTLILANRTEGGLRAEIRLPA